jgi:hypothetical protein
MEMNSESTNSNTKKHWESVHVCPNCAFLINLSQIDLRTITTGIVECPRWEWVGPIEIQVAEVDEEAG